MKVFAQFLNSAQRISTSLNPPLLSMFAASLALSATVACAAASIAPASIPGVKLVNLANGLSALNRPVYAAAPLNLNTSEYQFTLDGSIPISTDFDAVSVDISYYGVPWNSFLYEAPLPVSWSLRLDAMVKAVDAYELPVILSFAILGNDKRSCPSSNASDYPGTISPGVADFNGCTQCFDYDIVRNPIAAFIRQGYINYALAVSLAFNYTQTLALIDFGIDANRYLEYGCSAAEWASFSEFTQDVYASLREVYPAKAEGTIALYPSFSLETMMQAQDGMACASTNWMAPTAPASLIACAKAGYAALANIPRDTFAWSAYPSLPTANKGGFKPWYLSAPLSQLSAAEKAGMVVSSTGVLSTNLGLNFANTSDFTPPLQCATLIPSSITVATSWFNTLVAQVSGAGGYKAWLVNFKSARDVLFDSAMACPSTCTPLLQPYCNVILAYRNACKQAGVLPAACELAVKQAGTFGVRDILGNTKEPLYSALQAARKLPMAVAEAQ